MVTRLTWRNIICTSLVVLLLASVTIVELPRQVRAITTTFDADADAYLSELAMSADMNYGGSTDLRIQSLATQNQRAILRFDISSIPAGQTINSATLKLYVNSNMLATERTYGIYRITETDWIEGTANGAIQDSSCCWNARQYNRSLNWTTPGGTFTTDNETTTILPTAAGVWVEWTVTGQVQYAYINSIDAHFLVKDIDEGLMSVQFVAFNSREATDANLRPKLEVTYEPINQAPNTPTLNSPSDGATGISITPDLIFNYSDPDADDCIKFDLKVDNNMDFSSPEIDVIDYTIGGPWTSGSAITYTAGITLSGGTQYYWQVMVNDGVNWSNWSDGTWDFTTAATTGSTAIEIQDQSYSTAIATITFPVATPGTDVSNPSNDQGQTQIFGGAGIAKPVVTLVNTADISYIIWYNITTFTNSVVGSEHYLVNDKGAACADAGIISNGVIFDSNQSTGVTIGKATDGTAAQKDLYLKVALGNVALKSGDSALTILGEAP